MADLRDIALTAQDARSQMVEVPEWEFTNVETGQQEIPTYQVDSLTEAKRIEIADLVNDDESEYTIGSMSLLFMIAAVKDPTTLQPVFTYDDFEALQGKSARAIQRLSNVALDLSRFAGDDDEEAPKG